MIGRKPCLKLAVEQGDGVVEVGAFLLAYEVAGHDVLVGGHIEQLGAQGHHAAADSVDDAGFLEGASEVALHQHLEGPGLFAHGCPR